VDASGWSNESVTADADLYDSANDVFRLTVSSGRADDEIDVLLENVTESVRLASFTAERSQRNDNAEVGPVFGLYHNTGAANIAFERISVNP